MTDQYDVGDELLVPLVAGLLSRHVDEVRETYGARLPRLRSPEFYAAPEHVQTAVLVVLGSTWLFGAPGAAAMKDVSLDVHGAADWRRIAEAWKPLDELERRGLRIPRVRHRCDRCHAVDCTAHPSRGEAA